VKDASNISVLCLAIGVLLASACSIGHRERAQARATDFQDPVDSLIDSMVKDRSTWVDPPSPF
jgi:hypothetical protein